MFCAVTADLARYEQNVDRAEALEAAVEREEDAIHRDAELLQEILQVEVSDLERYQRSGRKGPGINIIGFDFDCATAALADVFRILSDADVSGHDGGATASGDALIELIDQAKDFVARAVRDAAQVRVEEGRNLAQQDQADMRGAE